jgi:2-polyprenyl-6-hydroxyphenyl methylase/3-demethylubiquinone-9 3-methyltransferase
LDIGCGGGLLSESLVRLGAHVTAIDPSVPLVQAAQAHAETFLLDQNLLERLDYRGGVTAEDLLQQQQQQQQQQDENNKNKFDIVCLLEVVEHATDPQALLQTAVQLLKPQGLLFVSTMSPTLASYLLTIVAAEHITGYVPVGTHDWNQYLHPHQVYDLLNQNNNHHTITDDTDANDVQELDVQGMALSRPPLCAGDWQWKLHPTDTSVNWIATYRKRAHDAQ